MSYVLVIDQDKRPLDPVHPGRARTLLAKGQAAVYRRYPFVLILTRRVPEPHTQPLRLKIDPGSKTTGVAVVNDATGQVLWGAWGSKLMATSKLPGGMAWWKGFMRAIVRPSSVMMAIRIRKERRRFLSSRERGGLLAAMR
jgi:hypothetical protein